MAAIAPVKFYQISNKATRLLYSELTFENAYTRVGVYQETINFRPIANHFNFNRIDNITDWGLTFEQLSISQDNGNTLIKLTSNQQVLAQLFGVNSNQITATDF